MAANKMNDLIEQRNGENYDHWLTPQPSFWRRLRERLSRPQESDAGGDDLQRSVRSIAGMLLFLLMLLSTGCETATPGKLPSQLVGDLREVLAVGDAVKLTFPGATEMSQVQRVRTDGKISLPLLGEVQAAGKQIGELQQELGRLYKEQLKNSEVIVTLEGRELAVYVSGAVNKPGKVLLDRPMTMLEAIMEAGGPTEMANLTNVVLIRNGNGKHNTQTFNLKPALRGQPTDAFTLRPYDMIQVRD
jgi:polysaccharide export outer membrane protein